MPLNPDVERLRRIDGTVVPDTTVVLSRPAIKGGEPDGVTQITKISVAGTPPRDYFFRLTLPDKPKDPRGGIEVDASKEGNTPVLKIEAEGIFGEEPGVLGTMTSLALEEAGVETAIVEPGNSNLTPEFLMQAGGQVLEATASDQGPVLVFHDSLPAPINEHSQIAA